MAKKKEPIFSKESIHYLIEVGKTLKTMDVCSNAIDKRLLTTKDGQMRPLKWSDIYEDAGEIQHIIEEIREMAHEMQSTYKLLEHIEWNE